MSPPLLHPYVSIIGVLLGPIAINHVAQVLPRHLVNGAVGWIAACGARGTAFLPFLTCTLASNLGIESLQPCAYSNLSQPLKLFYTQPQTSYSFCRLFFLAMMVILGLVWGFVPKRRKMTLADF